MLMRVMYFAAGVLLSAQLIASGTHLGTGARRQESWNTWETGRTTLESLENNNNCALY